MSKIIPILLFLTIGLFFIPQIWAISDSLVLTVNGESTYKSGQYPSIHGTVTDSEGNPISEVQIQANFPSRTILNSTNSLGEFTITSPIPAESGDYTIIVSATKDRLFVDTKTVFHVTAPKSHIQQLIIPQVIESKSFIPLSPENISNTTESKSFIQLSPRTISNITDIGIPENLLLKSIPRSVEAQNITDIKQEFLDGGNQSVKKRVQQTNEVIQNDLASLEKKYEFNTPRNAFLQFLDNIDSTVKDIFWGQFLLTEKSANQGHQAKENALDEGKSPKEAMDIFQQTAAISRSKIIEHNNKLNIEHGNATSSIQEQFDENGKLRTGK